MTHPCVLLVDLQYDFFRPDYPIGIGKPQKTFCLPGAFQLAELARSAGWPVIHVATEHTGRETLPRHCRDRDVDAFCVVGTPGADIVDGIVRDDERVISKRSYSAFFHTDLHTVIDRHSPIILGGLAADCCLMQTAFDAATHADKRVFVPYQAVSASTLDAYVFGLVTIAKSAGFVIDLSTLTTNDPSPNLQIDDADLSERLRVWFQTQQEKYTTVEGEFLRAAKDDRLQEAVAMLVARLRC